jgi:hypothetical protein
MSLLHLTLTLGLLALPTTLVQERLDGTWEAEFRASRVHLNVRMDQARGYSNYGRTVPMSELSALRRNGRSVSFELRRAAGVFRFEGVGDESKAAGRYEFTPDAQFRRSLEGLGISGLNPRRMVTLALGNVTLNDVRYLKQNVRGGFDAADLVRMIDHGADPEFVRGLNAAGFGSLSVEQLVRTRDHGVDPEYIDAMRKAGIRLTLTEYVTARDHGVTPQYVRGMRDLGFKNEFEQLLRARDHGVDAQFINDFSTAGLGDLTLSHYVELRDHGVTGDFALAMRELGYQNVSAGELIRLRNHGVTPAYVRKTNREAGRLLAVDELVRRRSH